MTVAIHLVSIAVVMETVGLVDQIRRTLMNSGEFKRVHRREVQLLQMNDEVDEVVGSVVIELAVWW